LPNDLGDSLPTKSVKPADSKQVVATVSIAIELRTIHSTSESNWAIFSDENDTACPLFLALRALRI
jgi:hypothetical protein